MRTDISVKDDGVYSHHDSGAPSFVAMPRFAITLIRISLGAVFLWSSLSKLYQPYEFLLNVYQYNLLGASSGLFLARSIPWIELITGIALIQGVLIRGASVIGTILLTLFITAQAISLSRSQEISCGCFSAKGDPISFWTVAVTGTILVGCLVLACDSIERKPTG